MYYDDPTRQRGKQEPGDDSPTGQKGGQTGTEDNLGNIGGLDTGMEDMTTEEEVEDIDKAS